MDNKITNTVERILQYIEHKGISIRAFSQSVGISHSLLTKIKSLGSDKLENIFAIYKELNPIWVLTGEGSMLKEYNTGVVTEPDSLYYRKIIDCILCSEKQKQIDNLTDYVNTLKKQLDQAEKDKELIKELLSNHIHEPINKQANSA